MSKKLPAVTHLQFVVLTQVRDGDAFGRDIRKELARRGERRTLAAFYQMMSRLEESSLVEGWYDQRVVDGQSIKERCYRITPAGKRAWAQTRDFYAALSAEGLSRA
jgi:DNA-binding PadR family transcriptional regulator